MYKFPICVDLDGTLVKTNITAEMVILYIKSFPWNILKAISWIIKGKGYLKVQLSKVIHYPVERLPFDHQMLDYLSSMKNQGHPIYLVTSAHKSLASSINKHLGIFDDAYGSDSRLNLNASQKIKLLSDKFGKEGYIYIGHGKTPNGASFKHKNEVSSDHKNKTKQLISNCIKSMRPHQWSKNVLVFLPVIAGHQLQLDFILNSFWAFISFSLMASGIYILNDILDIDSDRQHQEKRHRPIPSGKISLREALILSLLLLSGSIILGYFVLSDSFLVVLLSYFVLTTLYSFYIKSLRLLDVVSLSLLYIARVIAGYEATDLAYSNWLLAFTGCLFLSLAFIKRYTEIKKATTHTLKGRAYTVKDKEVVAQFGITSGYMAVLVLALYIESETVKNLYHHPYMLWGICPIIIYLVSHLWMQAEHGKVTQDPVIYVLTKDYRFYVSLVLIAILVLFAK